MKESEKLTTYSRKDVIDRLAETRDFENADMRKANLAKIDFSNCNLKNANMAYSNLKDLSLIHI